MLTPWWFSNVRRPRLPTLRRHCSTDVVVVGAGITGLTCAYLIKKAGMRVVVLERDRCGDGDSGHTTAHLTAIPDRRLHDLVKYFGSEHARAVWEAGEAAIQELRQIICAERIDCDFRTVPAYLHGSLRNRRARDASELRREWQTAHRLGIEASPVNTVPGIRRAGVAFSNQAIFHPLKYLAHLAREIPGGRGQIYEHSEAQQITDTPLAVHANGCTVRCKHVVIATHVPLMGKNSLVNATLFQTKLYPYSTYAIAATLPSGSLPEASYFDTTDPYYYLRVEHRRTHDFAILGGEDHKTGQKSDGRKRYSSLRRILNQLVKRARIEARWSGQVIETNDGLPLIGEISNDQYVATGFAGNGMTFGVLGAMMLTDMIQGRRNPWSQLFDVHRKKLRGGTWNYIKENVDYPYYMIKDRLQRAERKSPRSIRGGQGAILRINGKRVAVSRDDRGKLHEISPICTHMGCLVHWNSVERTWDCPCHGSRFHPDGRVHAGPAEEPLAPVLR
jgi:glycine/D-amino acid oxidase-like deaminating enzyme/nitrite reductase/ring-hydroxylating ferredoxin subunit